MRDYLFYNLSERHLEFADVFARIYSFMKADPRNLYRLSIGTDSQAHGNDTRFITAIHVHRVGKGAWGCLRNEVIRRKVRSLREKICLETHLSQEIACLFTPHYMGELLELVYPYRNEGARLVVEIHLDIGNRGLTKEFILDMTQRVRAMGLTAKIKPDSYAAFSYANRYTK